MHKRILTMCLLITALSTSTVYADEHYIKACEAKMEAERLADELYCDSLEEMAICVQAESGNQSFIGRVLVAETILNRVDDKDYPNTIHGVISQKGQFSSYTDGGMAKAIPDDTTFKAVRHAIKNRKHKVIYFRTKRFSSYGTPWKKVGDHYFSTK